MPVMTGYEVLDRINEAHMEELPVIVITSSSDEQSEQKALEAGVWDFVTKPFNPKILLSRLKNAVARSQIAAFERMQYLSEHDELTGLYNRRKMFLESRRLLDEYPDENFVFIRLDIDRFALFNTFFGEETGNQLLKYLADNVLAAANFRKHAICGRMNADVFCVCATYGGDPDILREQIEGMQNSVGKYREDYHIEISVGACIIEAKSLSIDEYYFRASTAALHCKDRYDTHLAFYDEAVGRRIENELTITNEMQQALDEEQFTVYLQPKFNLSSENMCGAEALVRWIHPVKGLVSPGAFIPVFECNGFIAKLDYYVWEKTCQMLRAWLDAGKTPFPISVNISRVSLYNPRLAENIFALVNKYGLPVSLLQLEVTESAYMTNPDLMENTIDSLHNAGFTILMDDFGSGYSSLNTLKTINIDVLKVDMKFLPTDDESGKGEIILSSVIKMANWLGMSVIVEGVETRRQRDFLVGAGCDCVQGFYYSKPIPHTEYESRYVFAGADIENYPDAENTTNTAPQHNMTILVIDDNELDRAILYENFRELYHMEMCENVEEALAFLKRNRSKVRLMLVDNMMPGMSGMEFLRYCRRDESLDAIPKIMITASDSVDDQVKAFNEGAYDYITKPLIREILVARVRHVMETSCRTSVFDTVERGYQRRSELDTDTNLLNKPAFLGFSTRLIESLPDARMAMMTVDIDDFKKLVASHGQETGAALIHCVADELTSAFRKTDLIARLGRDRFAVLMTKLTNTEVARRKADEIVQTFMFQSAQKLHIDASISIGLAFSEPDMDVGELISRAEQALKESKDIGKARSSVYGDEVPAVVQDDKPVVLICSDDRRLFDAIALAYGNEVAFDNVSTYGELTDCFQRYDRRICAICLDMQAATTVDSTAFYQYILSQGGGERIPLLALCMEDNLEQLKQALELRISDILTLPPQVDVIRRRLSRTILKSQSWTERQDR